MRHEAVQVGYLQPESTRSFEQDDGFGSKQEAHAR